MTRFLMTRTPAGRSCLLKQAVARVEEQVAVLVEEQAGVLVAEQAGVLAEEQLEGRALDLAPECRKAAQVDRQG